jgi:hypothetical protein
VSEPHAELAPRPVEVMHPVTGELLNLAQESLDRLAGIVVGLQEHRARLADFERQVNDVMVAHLDRAASWTARVGDPTGERQFEIKAPSPEAGQAVYRSDTLVPALKALVDAGAISPEAASKACARQLVLSLAVPWGANLDELAETVQDAIGIQIAGVEVDVVSASPSERPVQAGIKALRKIPGVAEALDRVKVTPEPGPRRATVKVKVRG